MFLVLLRQQPFVYKIWQDRQRQRPELRQIFIYTKVNKQPKMYQKVINGPTVNHFVFV